MRPLDRSAATDLSPAPRGAPGEDGQPLDPELLALNAPPQGQRIAALTVMAAAVVCAMALVLALRGDMQYALSSAQPIDLGDVQSVSPTRLASNSYVRISGLPSLAHGARFSLGLLGSKYRVFPLAGQRTIYVQVEDDGGESFVRSEFAGRLVTFEELGSRYAELARVMQRDDGLPVTGASFLLLADEPPSTYRWTWLIGLLCLAFVLLDAYFIVRWFKPVRWAEIAAGRD